MHDNPSCQNSFAVLRQNDPVEERPDLKPTAETLAQLPCPICSSSQISLHLDDEEQALDPALFGSSRIKITHGRILSCNACGFRFRQVRSHPEEMAELYRKMDARIYELEKDGRLATAKRHFAILRRHTTRKTGKLLDVGCASGLFLAEARRHGWSITGIEPSETLYEKARDLLGPKVELQRTILEKTDFRPASFDVITMWDVLEHVPDPLLCLKSCAKLLKPDGVLLLNVPDIESIEARLLGRKWPLLLAEHLNYFNRRSLRLAGERAGLRWKHFGRRPVSFSISYILFRLSQHHITGSSMARRVIRGRLGTRTIPIFLGEIYGVWLC